MPKTKISEYSTTNSDNTDIESINIAEGCAPSGINNAIRELMVHLKEFQTGASGDAFTFAGGVLISGTANTITGNVLMSGTNTITGSTTATFAAGAVGTPSIAAHGDTNTGIFFPAADTIAFAEGGAEAMRIDSSGRVGIGTTSPSQALTVGNGGKIAIVRASPATNTGFVYTDSNGTILESDTTNSDPVILTSPGTGGTIRMSTAGSERMRITSAGNVGIGTSSPSYPLSVSRAVNGGVAILDLDNVDDGNYGGLRVHLGKTDREARLEATYGSSFFTFYTNGSERARITSAGRFLIGTTSYDDQIAGTGFGENGFAYHVVAGGTCVNINRQTNDGILINFQQDNVSEGNISVSGNTVSYNAFAGSHWSQLQEGRGYNPEILRGTVMSSIGEMCEWKSVTWTETIEHPAVPAVDAKDAVLDEEGNIIEPAIEAIEGKDAWTETFNKRGDYLGQLPIGATFEENGVTKTVVDDGNERLPKVKISDVVGDKAVYGVFQTWDEVQDMLVTSLGAFVVRIAAGVTVQIGDLLESNGDGCAKVQDDDVIRSKTIGKVTSITPSATYADGSYTVPAVLYCG